MLEPTKTKFFKYTDKDAFAFKGQYLDITTLFDAVLVNGFNLNIPQTFSIANNILTIVFASAHGFENYSVIKIENADVAMFNREFRVRNVPNTTTIEILVDETFTTIPTNFVNITIKTAPLGYNKKFEASGKRIYTSPNWGVAMKVDDYQHANWSSDWARFARIQFANDYSNVDTPIGYTYPNRDLSVITTYSGQTYKSWTPIKICISKLLDGSEDNDRHFGSNSRAWYIFGDDKGFYFIHSISDFYALDKTNYHYDYIGNIKPFNTDFIPKNSVYFSGYYNNDVSSTYNSETSCNDICRNTYHSGAYQGLIMNNTGLITWLRFSPMIHLYTNEGLSGQGSVNMLNSYEYLGQDVLAPIMVEQFITSLYAFIGSTRGIQSILTEIMSTRPERNSDYTIKSRTDNSCLIYITNNRSGIVAVDIVKDW